MANYANIPHLLLDRRRRKKQNKTHVSCLNTAKSTSVFYSCVDSLYDAHIRILHSVLIHQAFFFNVVSQVCAAEWSLFWAWLMQQKNIQMQSKPGGISCIYEIMSEVSRLLSEEECRTCQNSYDAAPLCLWSGNIQTRNIKKAVTNTFSLQFVVLCCRNKAQPKFSWWSWGSISETDGELAGFLYFFIIYFCVSERCRLTEQSRTRCQDPKNTKKMSEPDDSNEWEGVGRTPPLSLVTFTQCSNKPHFCFSSQPI